MGAATLAVCQVIGSDGASGTFVTPSLVANVTEKKFAGGKLVPMTGTNDGAQLCKVDGGPFVSGTRPVYENVITVTGGAAAVDISTLDSGAVYAALSSGRSIGISVTTGQVLVSFSYFIGGFGPSSGVGYPIGPTTPLWIPCTAAGAMQFYADSTAKVYIIITL